MAERWWGDLMSLLHLYLGTYLLPNLECSLERALSLEAQGRDDLARGFPSVKRDRTVYLAASV